MRAATTRDKGHGRVEVRSITTTTWANGYADWPRVGQVFRVERERRAKGVTTVEVVYGVTSLTREQAGRPGCWRWCGRTEESRTGCTTSGT